ncbi:MAG: NAD-dependent epimerase/dehydratase family protein [Candidatus Omnitrophica bacterium]|nr:NAD-dependent epimerase/dehydratase family protein [Candidatus Omnitrophota bacterium]
MNVLVTGGSGFIGSHIAGALIQAGHKVRIFDIKNPYQDRAEFVKGDLRSRHDIAGAVKGQDIVYHIGAFSNIDFVKDNPIETIESNIMGTAYLLEECRNSGVRRFLFASSIYICGGQGHIYTTTKLASEMLCKNYHLLYGLDYTILRFATAYGPGSRGEDVVSIFVKKALNNDDIIIHGSGRQKRNFTYAEDIARGCAAALCSAAANKTFVLSSSEAVSIKDLAFLVKDVLSSDSTIKIDGSKQRPDDYTGNIEGLEDAVKQLSWSADTRLREGIMKYRNWSVNR